MTRAKFKKRTTTNYPDTGIPVLGLWFPFLVLVLPAAIAFSMEALWLGVLLAVPAAPFVGFWLFGRCLLAAALVSWRIRGLRGVLVYSDSPIWKPYIEREWLPRLGHKLVPLNWSDRNRWGLQLDVLVWRHFCGHYRSGTGVHRDYNPAVILLRGLLHPAVYRFHGSFDAAKHGDTEQLEAMEADLSQRLGL